MELPFHIWLSPEQLRAAGISEAWPFALADKVRFAELDMLNHVNNVAYLTWLESSRIAYFKQIGLTTYKESATEPRLVIRRGEIDWLQEMLADETYIVVSRTIAYRTTSFTMRQEIWSGGTRRAAFTCVVVLLAPDGSGRLAIPDHIKTHFDTVDGVTQDAP